MIGQDLGLLLIWAVVVSIIVWSPVPKSDNPRNRHFWK